MQSLTANTIQTLNALWQQKVPVQIFLFSQVASEYMTLHHVSEFWDSEFKQKPPFLLFFPCNLISSITQL